MTWLATRGTMALPAFTGDRNSFAVAIQANWDYSYGLGVITRTRILTGFLILFELKNCLRLL